MNVVDLKTMSYGEALALQEKVLILRQRGEIEDTLLLVEHPPVLTLGARGNRSNILIPAEKLKSMGVEIYEVNRGGDVTYHGPGQIVGYPIMDLNNYGKDIRYFVGKLEEVFIRLLQKEYNIQASRGEKKYTGVWVGNEKITAIGISVKRWVTMHGFAFNVNTDLDHFKWIVPCGIADKGVTSLSKLLERKSDFDSVKKTVADTFCEIFGAKQAILTKEQLLAGTDKLQIA